MSQPKLYRCSIFLLLLIIGCETWGREMQVLLMCYLTTALIWPGLGFQGFHKAQALLLLMLMTKVWSDPQKFYLIHKSFIGSTKVLSDPQKFYPIHKSFIGFTGSWWWMLMTTVLSDPQEVSLSALLLITITKCSVVPAEERSKICYNPIKTNQIEIRASANFRSWRAILNWDK